MAANHHGFTKNEENLLELVRVTNEDLGTQV